MQEIFLVWEHLSGERTRTRNSNANNHYAIPEIYKFENVCYVTEKAQNNFLRIAQIIATCSVHENCTKDKEEESTSQHQLSTFRWLDMNSLFYQLKIT